MAKRLRLEQITPEEAYKTYLDKNILVVDITDGRTWGVQKMVELTGVEVKTVVKNPRYVFFEKKDEAISED